MEADDYPAAGRKRDPLRRSASLWLELMAALLLGLAFAGPKGCQNSQAQHLVCVLDGSASMGAAEPDSVGASGTFGDAALELLRARIRGQSPRSLVTLIESAPRPRILAGPAALPAEALASLEDYRPGASRHDLDPALALALQVAGEGRVLLITDHPPGQGSPDSIEWVSVGQPLDNVAITHAARGAGEADSDRILVSLTAFSQRAVQVELSIHALGQELQRQRVLLEPEQRRHFSFDVPRQTPGIEVRLSPDALAIDDQAYLAPLPKRTLGLASSLNLEEALALGLTSGAEGASTIDRWLGLIENSEEVQAERAHLAIAASQPLAAGPQTWSLVLESGAPGAPEDLIGPFLFERAHPLLRGLTLSGVVWSVAPELELAGTPLVAAGNLTILSERAGTQRRSYHFNLNPFRASLQRSPDWPILLANLAELRRDELPGALRSNLAIGETLVYQSKQPASYVLERQGGGLRREVRAMETLQIEGLELPGLYTLSSQAGELARFGLSFKDPAESDLRQLEAGQRDSSAAYSQVRASMGPLESALLGLTLGLLLLDWWVLKRQRIQTRVEGLD